MNDAERKARLRYLQRQAREHVRCENDLKIERALLAIRDVYTGRIDKEFDQVLSAKIDALNFLIGE